MGDKLCAHLKLRVTDLELAKAQRDAAARNVTVSEHVRELIRVYGELSVKPATAALREAIPELTIAAELPARVVDRLPLVNTERNPTPKGKTCVHGTAKGYNCWQCRGLAKMESNT